MLEFLLQTSTIRAENSALIVNMDTGVFWRTKKKPRWKQWAQWEFCLFLRVKKPLLSLGSERPLLVKRNIFAGVQWRFRFWQ